MERKTEQEPRQLITVPFHGDTLFVIDFEGKPYAPLRPIVEGMGLWWNTQHRKIVGRFAATVVMMTTVAADGKQRKTICLPVRKLPAWLYSVDARKVKPELREKIRLYQEECDEVLWQYWTEGVAKRKPVVDIDPAENNPPTELPLPPLPPELQARIDRRAWEMAQPYFAEFKEVMEKSHLVRQGALAPEEFEWDGHWHAHVEKVRTFSYSALTRGLLSTMDGKPPAQPDPLAVVLAQAMTHAWFDGRRYGEIREGIISRYPFREFTMQEIEEINNDFAQYLPWAEKLVQRVRESGQQPLIGLEDCKLIPLREAAEMTGMTYGWWYRAMAVDHPVLPIRTYRFGRSIRVHRGDLAAWIDKGRPARRRRPTKTELIPPVRNRKN
ncbi:phage antirepressor N-terminal domain-containing protein [Desulfurivibrio sp. D14AmB]|uniref:phage antirepressor N-terminal domain-containing protein n=1 Tax=Desulfurivibrio sp. D14AmB TaxID=3374370 RepID=UPI00376ED003